jgi:hypothetical protein
MGLVNLIEKLINEHASAAVMEKRLLLVKEEAVDRKNAELIREVERLTQENTELKSKVPAASRKDEFIEFEGAAFKQKADGSLHHAIYCPVHYVAGCSADPICPFSCPHKDCAWVSYITPQTLGRAILRATPGTLSNALLQ